MQLSRREGAGNRYRLRRGAGMGHCRRRGEPQMGGGVSWAFLHTSLAGLQ